MNENDTDNEDFEIDEESEDFEKTIDNYEYNYSNHDEPELFPYAEPY